MADDRSTEAWQPFTIGGVARFAVASRWRLLGVQCLFAIAVAGVAIWFVNRAWMPVIDEAIDHMPQTGAIADGRLAWPSGATLHVEGPAGEPFMRMDVQPSGLTNVLETVDLVVAFEADRVLLGSSLGLGRCWCWAVLAAFSLAGMPSSLGLLESYSPYLNQEEFRRFFQKFTRSIKLLM